MTYSIPKNKFLHNIVYPDLSPAIIDEIASSLKEDLSPIPTSELRAKYYDGCDLSYWLSGLRDFNQIEKHILSKIEPNRPLNILDFGGSSGRVFRHFLYKKKDLNLFLVDLDENSVDFVLNNLQYVNVKNVFKSHYAPPLPFEDDQFDVIYAFSVFTHLDSLEYDWLNELKRIVKVGAYLYITVHSEITWAKINDIYLYSLICDDSSFKDLHDTFKDQMPVSKLVFNKSSDILMYHNMLQTFHHSEYIKQEWSKIFSVVDIIHEAHSYQSVIILKKEG